MGFVGVWRSGDSGDGREVFWSSEVMFSEELWSFEGSVDVPKGHSISHDT